MEIASKGDLRELTNSLVEVSMNTNNNLSPLSEPEHFYLAPPPTDNSFYISGAVQALFNKGIGDAECTDPVHFDPINGCFVIARTHEDSADARKVIKRDIVDGCARPKHDAMKRFNELRKIFEVE